VQRLFEGLVYPKPKVHGFVKVGEAVFLFLVAKGFGYYACDSGFWQMSSICFYDAKVMFVRNMGWLR
jgi:hypothetical protein